jgi:hypothetical protein
MKRAVLLPILLLAGIGLWGLDESGGGIPWIFGDTAAGGHRGKINAVYYDGRRLLSIGEDGFLGLWDLERGEAVGRFQLSGLPLLAIARRPGKSQIAVIEDDGLGHCRISAWDYLSLEKLFTLPFQDPVRSVSYSAGGTYLVICRSGRTGIALVDSETGELLLDPENIAEEFPSSAGFAAIGRTERAMLVYSPAGTLSYWELGGDRELSLIPALDGFGLSLNFEAPLDLRGPLLFGNNRFLAGFDGGGLVVLEADTGYELDRDPSLPWGTLAAGGDELYCLAGPPPGGGRTGTPVPAGREGLYRFRMDASGNLQRRGFYPSPAGAGALAVIPGEGEDSPPLIALGTAEGEVLRLGSPWALPARLGLKKQIRIPEAAAGQKEIAFLTGENSLGRIPLDFLELQDGFPLTLEDAGAYTRITAAGASPMEASFPDNHPAADRFILWQDRSPLPSPALRAPGTGPDLLLLDRPPPERDNRSSAGGFSLRSVSALEDRGLFLDMGGNISIISLAAGETQYTETSPGSLDAAFIDRDSIILGRGSSGDPFLMIDTKTRETVTLPYPASIGLQVYRGPSGAIYGTTIEEERGERRTVIIRLDLQDPAASARLAEYRGEDAEFSIAEAEGLTASTLGEGGIYGPWGTVGFERGPAFPLRITGGDRYFIVLDTEGGISWYDPRSGELLALFRLYEDAWTLVSKEQRKGGSVFSQRETSSYSEGRTVATVRRPRKG